MCAGCGIQVATVRESNVAIREKIKVRSLCMYLSTIEW